MKMITLWMMMLADNAAAPTPDVELLDFTASYCEPCRQMVPILQRMEHDKFPVRRIDITEEHELARRFKVDRLPTLVLMVEGKEVRRFVGLRDEAELRSEMNRAARRLSESRSASASPTVPKQPQPQPQPTQETEPVRTADARPARDARPSIKDIFSGLFGTETKPSPFEFPTFRGQSPEISPEILQGLQAAAAATVRVRVAGTSTKDGKRVQDVGTGTIIYSAAGKTIILTCAHVFLDIATSDADVEVEVFEQGNVNPHRAKLIAGDHNSDIALLSIQSSRVLPSVRLTQLAPQIEKGQSLVSFGCNAGADPTRLDTKLVDINRYDGPANLVCTTDPKSGRSGGGLFNAAGELVGVCSCADRESREGLYMAHAAILKFVSEQQLQPILQTAPKGGGEDAASTFADLLSGKSNVEKTAEGPASDVTPGERIAKVDPPAFDESVAPAEKISATTPNVDPNDAGLSDPASVASTSENSITGTPVAGAERSGPELTIVIDDKTPGSQKRVIVIPQASSWMMELLTGETIDDNSASMTAALRPSIPSATIRTPSKPRNRMVNSLP